MQDTQSPNNISYEDIRFFSKYKWKIIICDERSSKEIKTDLLKIFPTNVLDCFSEKEQQNLINGKCVLIGENLDSYDETKVEKAFGWRLIKEVLQNRKKTYATNGQFYLRSLILSNRNIFFHNEGDTSRLRDAGLQHCAKLASTAEESDITVFGSPSSSADLEEWIKCRQDTFSVHFMEGKAFLNALGEVESYEAFINLSSKVFGGISFYSKAMSEDLRNKVVENDGKVVSGLKNTGFFVLPLAEKISNDILLDIHRLEEPFICVKASWVSACIEKNDLVQLTDYRTSLPPIPTFYNRSEDDTLKIWCDISISSRRDLVRIKEILNALGGEISKDGSKAFGIIGSPFLKHPITSIVPVRNIWCLEYLLANGTHDCHFYYHQCHLITDNLLSSIANVNLLQVKACADETKFIQEMFSSLQGEESSENTAGTDTSTIIIVWDGKTDEEGMLKAIKQPELQASGAMVVLTSFIEEALKGDRVVSHRDHEFNENSTKRCSSGPDSASKRLCTPISDFRSANDLANMARMLGSSFLRSVLNSNLQLEIGSLQTIEHAWRPHPGGFPIRVDATFLGSVSALGTGVVNEFSYLNTQSLESILIAGVYYDQDHEDVTSWATRILWFVNNFFKGMGFEGAYFHVGEFGYEVLFVTDRRAFKLFTIQFNHQMEDLSLSTSKFSAAKFWVSFESVELLSSRRYLHSNLVICHLLVVCPKDRCFCDKLLYLNSTRSLRVRYFHTENEVPLHYERESLLTFVRTDHFSGHLYAAATDEERDVTCQSAKELAVEISAMIDRINEFNVLHGQGHILCEECKEEDGLLIQGFGYMSFRCGKCDKTKLSSAYLFL